MAIRERKGRAAPYEVYWINPYTKKRESRSFAERHEAEKEDSLIKHRLRFDRESFDKGGEEEQQEDTAMTLHDCYVLYLQQKQFSKGSIKWQITSMRLALRKLGARPLVSITRKDLESLKEEMLRLPVKPATTRGRLSVLRTVLRWAADRGYCEDIRFPRLPPAYYEHFIPPTPDELRALIANAAPHVVRVIVLGAQMGVRVGPSELFRLTWQDVDLAQAVIRVNGAKKNPNAPWREIPIRESLLPLFAAWAKEDAAKGILWLVHHKGEPVASIKTAWEAALRRAGITRRIRPYDLRHAFATEAIAAGVDLGTVAKLMGHSTPTMILTHYQHVKDVQKRSAVEALPGIGNEAKRMRPNKEALTHDR